MASSLTLESASDLQETALEEEVTMTTAAERWGPEMGLTLYGSVRVQITTPGSGW